MLWRGLGAWLLAALRHGGSRTASGAMPRAIQSVDLTLALAMTADIAWAVDNGIAVLRLKESIVGSFPMNEVL